MKRKIALCIIIALMSALLFVVGALVYSVRLELDTPVKAIATGTVVLAISCVIAWAFGEVSR